jgi:hypothetical protein
MGNATVRDISAILLPKLGLSRFQSERFGAVETKCFGLIRANGRLSLERLNQLSHFVLLCRPRFLEVTGGNVANRSRQRTILY